MSDYISLKLSPFFRNAEKEKKSNLLCANHEPHEPALELWLSPERGKNYLDFFPYCGENVFVSTFSPIFGAELKEEIV